MFNHGIWACCSAGNDTASVKVSELIAQIIEPDPSPYEIMRDSGALDFLDDEPDLYGESEG